MSNSATDSSSSSDEEEIFTGLLCLRRLLVRDKKYIDNIPCRTSDLTGKAYTLEILVGHPIRCFESFRMRPHVFMNLCERLKLMGLLKDKRDVSAEEGLAMGLSILCHGTRQRIVAERFQHSTATVHAWSKIVIRALVALGTNLIKPINRGCVQPEILTNTRWFPYFKNCIGAIDGTHVAAWAPAAKQKTFRGRKATLVTQNIMAACSHDMLFTFVYTGWEGTANDSRVFLDAITREVNKFPFPTGDYYYVVDAGYPNVPGFLAPYRGERYHLNDFRGRGRLTTKYEVFNQRHSSVRNVIERAFGVLKARFPILKSIPNYPLRRQRLIPTACCALHNFIRMEDRADRLFTLYGREYIDMQEEVNPNVIQEGIQIDLSQQEQMSEVRNIIADQLWSDYNNHPTN